MTNFEHSFTSYSTDRWYCSTGFAKFIRICTRLPFMRGRCGVRRVHEEAFHPNASRRMIPSLQQLSQGGGISLLASEHLLWRDSRLQHQTQYPFPLLMN